MQAERVPPLTANINQACYACFKEEVQNILLKRCSRCRRVSYCSLACQNANWASHKVFCKAFHILENDSMAQIMLGFASADAPSTSISFLNSVAEEQARNKVHLWEAAAKRQLNLIERNLIGWEPRCIACCRTDQDLRMQSAQLPPGVSRTLKPCSDCKMTFYCSEKHWETAQHAHVNEPCEGGHAGLSHCQMNQEILADIRFANAMANVPGSDSTTFQWAPERTKPSWIPLEGVTWKSEYEDDISHEFKEPQNPIVDPILRAASDGLTFPMTILWGLEKLNDDEAWTHKKNLTIHLIGAYDKEVMNAKIFEEILHRLPEVKKLQLVLCGPELAKIISRGQRGDVLEMETCPKCRRQGRKRTHQHYDLTYHALVEKLGEKFAPPDLAVAFNSGSSQESVDSWKDTFKLLVKQKIPTLFTAYNREEAEAEAKLLRNTGAKLVEVLGPRPNPWGSLLAKSEPNSLRGFYAVNGWLAGGFKGDESF